MSRLELRELGGSADRDQSCLSSFICLSEGFFFRVCLKLVATDMLKRPTFSIATLLSVAWNFITVYLFSFSFSNLLFIYCSQPQQNLIKNCSVFPGSKLLRKKMCFWQFQEYWSFFFWINPQFYSNLYASWLADSVWQHQTI